MTRTRSAHPTRRKPIRDYHRKRYGNPLFGGKRPRSSGGRKNTIDGGSLMRRIGMIIALIALTTGLGYLAWGPTFKISAIEIGGATPLTEQRIRELLFTRKDSSRLLIFPQSTLFFFDARKAKRDVEEEFFFDHMTVEKRLPGTVIVTVQEIPKRAVLFADNRFLALSASGAVIRELTEKEVQRMTDLPADIASVLITGLGAEMVELDTLKEEEGMPEAAKKNGNEHPLIFDDEHDTDPFEQEFHPSDMVLAAPTLDLMLQANVRLPDITGSAVRWFNVREKDETIDVTMDGDWHVYLTTALPFEVQGERLALVLRDKVGADRERLQYIDLRYNERIFFKLRDQVQE